MPRFISDSYRVLQLLLSVLFAAVVLTGCGGGGGSDSSSAPQSSFTAGPITGFGSVIINGTRFDVSRATVTDDQGRRYAEGDLKLGMVAQVDAGAITSTDTGQASQVQVYSAIIGPVDAINTNTRLLVVLGQTVDVSDTTVFGDSLPSGPFGIRVGDVLEIYGMLDTTTGHYAATRIEAIDNATTFKVRGEVSNLNTAGRVFMIGGETISYASLSSVPNLSNGMLVIANLQMTQDRNGNWIATQVTTPDRPLATETRSKVKLKGFITSVESPTHFSVNGIQVDASNAKVRPKNVSLTRGASVKVEGSASNGIIVATKVHIKKNGGKGKDEAEDDEDDEYHGFELHGVVDGFDASTGTFMLRGVTVRFGDNVVFKNGSRNVLTGGSKIEIKGQLSADGRRVVAESINFED